MNVFLTGSASGLGRELFNQLVELGHTVTAPTRDQLDLSVPEQVVSYNMSPVDLLINCAGTGIGGKIDFCNHRPTDMITILNTNLIAPLLLCQAVLKLNRQCRIVNVTSTNCNRYWPGDLAYSLSKQSLADLGSMLRVEYPSLSYLEVRLGLTKTNFNRNRYVNETERFQDLYATNHYQTTKSVVDKIVNVLFDNSIRFIEVSP